MKKALAVLSLGLAFGGTLASAAAGSQSTTVVMPVSATVANVCTFRGDGDEGGGPRDNYGKKDADGKTINDDPVSLPVYRANKDGTAVLATMYTLRCTSFTKFDTVVPNGPLKLSLFDSKDASLNGRTLDAEFTFIDHVTVKDGKNVGDVHVGNVVFKIPAGQWNAPAGTYRGELKVTINYQ